MAKDIVNANIHVLVDEKLGGIKREYVEVDREVENGDTVLVTKMDGKEVCQIDKVIDIDFGGDQSYETLQLDRAINGEDLVNMLFDSEDVIVLLEPTDIIHIDGRRYEMIDRKAKVGEKVMYVDESGESYGIVTEVLAVGAGVVDVAEYEEPSGAVIVGFSHDRYRVLVPVESTAADEPHPADPIDVIANLAQEVASLKRTVDRHGDEIDTLYKDKRTLGEELARLKQDGNKENPTGTSFADFCEGYIAYLKALKEAQS
ncbi:hypothetical protein [Bacillus velezensis]|uniref:hypothetical protein n=1 Tax=Bacillus velezensis TaxID=492670 RepID=UPI003D81B730